MARRSLAFLSRVLLVTFSLSLIPQITRPVEARDLSFRPPAVSERRHDRPIELIERRTSNSKTLLNPDGTLTTEIYPKPVHYRDASGQFQLVQNELVAEQSSGTVRNGGNRYKVEFKNKLGPDFFKFDYAGRTFSMTMDGARQQQAVWHGNKVLYPDVMAGVDLAYTVGDSFVKEEITVHNPATVPDSFNFTLRTKGAKAGLRGSKSLHFHDELTDEALWALSPMFMRDSAGAISAAVDMEMTTQGNHLRLKVTPDVAWLKDPQRVYPVVIDPTIVLQPDTSGGIDTTLANGDGLQDLNLGFDSTLSVGSAYSSLLKFDLSAIPRASRIESATLELSSLSAPPSSNTTGAISPAIAPVLSASDYTSSIRAGTYSVLFTYITPQGETLPSPAGLVTISDYQAIDVSIGALPSGTTGTKVYVGTVGDEKLVMSSSQPTVTITRLPEGTAPKPPSQSSGFVSAPTQPPSVSTAVALTGTTGFNQGTYYVRYTYLNSLGETTGSPAQSITMTDGQAVQVTLGKLPDRVTSANVYIGASPDTTFKVGNIPSGSSTRPVVFGTPSALMSSPAPRAFPAVVPDPANAPTLVRTTGTSPFVAGTYDVAYTFFSPNGETKASARQSIALTAGDTVKVTAGQPLPTGATGMRVYMGESGGPLNLVASQAGAQAANTQPTLQVNVPPGFKAVQPPASSSYSAPSSPTVKAMSLTTQTELKAGTYYVGYSLIYRDQESRVSGTTSVTITQGQAIEVSVSSLPTDAVGMRVYMGRRYNNLWLVATSMGSRTLITGDTLIAVPETNTTELPTPGVSPVNLSAIPPGDYYVSYTFTSETGESAPSEPSPVSVRAGDALHVTLPGIPSPATGANLYLGTSPTNLMLAQGITDLQADITTLPGADAPVLSTAERGESAPPKPDTPLKIEARNLSVLPAGTYSVRYTMTSGDMESLPSPPALVELAPGEAMSIVIPQLPIGVTGARVYVGPPHAERLVSEEAKAGVPLLVTSIPNDQSVISTDGRNLLDPPVVSASAGSGLSGGVYFSYSFYDSNKESHRSPETHIPFTSPNGTATLTTGPAPGWATGVRIYAGTAPGAGRLAKSVSVTPGASVTTSITRIPPSGMAVYGVTTSWSELDATWIRASANAPWFQRGGDLYPESAELALGGGPQVTADLTRLVRAWAEGVMPNNGILLNGVGSTVHFASSDHSDPTLRPVLTITYRERAALPKVTLTSTNVNPGEVLLAADVVAEPEVTVTRVDFYANGARVGTATKAPYSITWNTAHVPKGHYELVAKAYDQWGREGRSDWSLVLADSFDDQGDLGVITLPVAKMPIAVQATSASSQKTAESYPAENLLDLKNDTYWRSPGQPISAASETVRLDLTSSQTSVSLSIRPKDYRDRLTVKAEAVTTSGDVIAESAITILDTVTKSITISSTKSFSAVRLVFSNLKRDLASGLYHAEVSEVTGATLKLASVKSYQATYEARNATDGLQSTHWVSGGQSSPTGQEYLELALVGRANAFYIKPRTPGVAASIAAYRGQYEGWEQVFSIPSLEEGFYTLPSGLKLDRLRIYLTNLVGSTGPGNPNLYFAGIDEIVPYDLALDAAERKIESGEISLSTEVRQFRLDVEDSQPPGSRITYALHDGREWHSVTPGVPLSLPSAVRSVRLMATLSSASPLAIPTLSAWRLFVHSTQSVELMAGADTIPPRAELTLPSREYLSGEVTLSVATWDDVGVTRVELYADNDPTPLVVSTEFPFDLTLDTTRLTPGKHLLWVKAYDAAGNASVDSVPATTTYKAFTAALSESAKIDLERSANVAITSTGRATITAMSQEITLAGSGTVTRSFSAGPGLIQAWAPNVSDTNGCVAGYIQIKRGTSEVATDRVARGECRELRVAYDVPSSGTFSVTMFQENTTSDTPSATIRYYTPVAAGTPYAEIGSVVSVPIVTTGPLQSVTVNASVVKPVGTSVQFFASTDDGETWQPITLGERTALQKGGSRLRLKADLVSAMGSGYTYRDRAPELLSWTVDVTQYLPRQVVTISQVAPPRSLTEQVDGRKTSLQWQGSETAGVTYNVYRSTAMHPEGKAQQVATGLTNAALVDGSNLLRNSSFETSSSAYSVSSWAEIVHTYEDCETLDDGTIDCWLETSNTVSSDTVVSLAQSRAVRIRASGDPAPYGIYQIISSSYPAGTTLSLGAFVKGLNVVESGTQSVGITLTYVDNTTDARWASAQGGTFDWTRRQVSITATKPVKQVRVSLQLQGRGTVWIDAAELDTNGATDWNAGELDPSKVYYYRVTAIDKDGRESIPSNEVSTGAVVTVPTGLGVKGFWPYASASLAGGSGYVNLFSGNLAYTATDVIYPAKGLALTFRRTYNTQGASVPGPMGYGWDHNFNWLLVSEATGAMRLKEGDGSTFTFVPRNDGTNYESPPGAPMRLLRKPDGSHTLVRHDNNLLYTFGADGKLLQIAEPNGNALVLTYDSAGRLSAVAASSTPANALRFEYDRSSGYLIQMTAPGDTADSLRRVRYEYDSQGNLTRVFDMENVAVNHRYDDLHQLASVTDSNGSTTQIIYEGLPGTVSRVIHPDGGEMNLAYRAPGEKTGWTKTTVTDARGFTSTYQVDGSGLLKKQSYPYGTETPTGTSTATSAFDHDERWNLTKYTDPRGNAYAISYDGYGNVTSVTDPQNNVTRTLWTQKRYPGVPEQSLNVRTQITDAAGNATLFTTDDYGNVTRVVDPLLQVTEYAYRDGLLQSVKDANGHVTSYAYDPNGWLTKKTDPLGDQVTYSYDEGGNPTAITDPVGNQTRYVYDRLGRQKEITFADGSRQLFGYDGVGNLIETTDVVGAVTQYEYDSMGRAAKVHQLPDAGDPSIRYTTAYEYDKLGQLAALTDARGKRSTFTYDGAGRRLTATDPLGKKTSYAYDPVGNLIKTTDPLSNAVTAEYDSLNQRTKTTIPQSGTYSLEQKTSYDSLGRVVSQADALGNTTTYYYDAVGRLVMVVDPMGFGTNYLYDSVGNRVAVVDAQRRTTHYVYDAAYRLAEEKRPDGVSVFTTYDQAGNPTAVTNGRNQTIGYRYDNRNRLIETSYSGGRNVRYTYDGAGRRTAMTDWNGVTRYQYNLLGWVEQVEDPWGHQVSYGYDSVGNRTSMRLQYPGVDFTWTYSYDDASRLASIQSPGVAKANTFTYDAVGQLTNASYANSDTVAYTYDRAHELTGVASRNGSSVSLLSLSYQYDKAGRRTSLTGSGFGTPAYYKYDAGSRLTASGTTSSATDREYYHDLVGNRHTLAVNTGDLKGVSTYVYDQTNRLIEEFGPLSAKQGGGRYHQSYTYDADGVQIRAERDGKEVTLYGYDEESRLLQVTNSLGQITRYTYDGDGKRVRMEDPSGTTLFIYDGNEVLAEVDVTGTLQAAYTRTGSGQIISQWQKGETYWYHQDGLGSTILVTDESGRTRNRYEYDEYGNLLAGTVEEIVNRYTYTGQAWDSAAGLYYYKARYYNPMVGRFLTQDSYKGSAWQPWTQNLYVYVSNNPVNLVDPTGHSACPSEGPCQEAVRTTLTVIQGGGGAAAVGSGSSWLTRFGPLGVFLAVVLTPGHAGETNLDLVEHDLGRNTELRAALEADPDDYKKALNVKHYQSCQSEMAGQAVAYRADGKPFDHCKEVSDAQQGVLNRINQLKGFLDDSRLFDPTRKLIEERLGGYSRLLDSSEAFFRVGPSPTNPLSPKIPRGVPMGTMQ